MRVVVLPTKYITYQSHNYVAGNELDMDDENAIIMAEAGDVGLIDSDSALSQENITLKPEVEADNA